MDRKCWYFIDALVSMAAYDCEYNRDKDFRFKLLPHIKEDCQSYLNELPAKFKINGGYIEYKCKD